MSNDPDATPPPQPTRPSDAERWGKRLAIMWTFAYAALIVIVSLIPSQIRTDHASIMNRLDLLRQSCTFRPNELHSLRDMATNFILYVPLGLLVAWTVPQRGGKRWFGLLLGACLSFTMEGLQIFTTRYPSVWDLAMNGTGHIAGFIVVAQVRAQRGLTAAIFVGRHDGSTRQRLAAGLRQVYVPLFGLLALLPFNVTVAMSDVWAKLSGTLEHGGHIWLSPLGPWPAERLVGLPTAALLLLPFGFLSVVAHPERGKRSYVRYMAFAAIISLMIEGAQLFVRARSTDLMQPLCAALGAGLGVWIARAWDQSVERTPDGERAFSPTDGLLLAILAYCVVLLVVAWEPFTFVGSWKEAAQRLIHETDWMPLHGYASGVRSLAIWRDLGREAGFYIPLGMMLQAYLRRVKLPSWMPPRIVVAAGIVAGVGTFLELGQSAVIGRYADSTDIVSHCLGGGLGYLVLSALTRSPSPAAGAKTRSDDGNAT